MSQIVGATEEVEEEEVTHEPVLIQTFGANQFMQMSDGSLVKVEPDMEYEDNIIYRFVEKWLS